MSARSKGSFRWAMETLGFALRLVGKVPPHARDWTPRGMPGPPSDVPRFALAIAEQELPSMFILLRPLVRWRMARVRRAWGLP